MSFLSPQRAIATHSDGAESVAFSPDGAVLAAGGCDGTVTLWDFGSAEQIRTLNETGKYVASVSFSADGALLASYSLGSAAVKLWDTREWKLRQSVPIANPNMARGAVVSPDGASVALFGGAPEIELAALQRGGRSRRLKVEHGTANCCAFSPDSGVLVVGTAGDDMRGTLQLWDAGTGLLRRVLSGFGSVVAIAYSPVEALLAGICVNAEVRLWDARSGESRGVLSTQGRGRAFSKALAFSPDGRLLASGCYGNRVHCWELSALAREMAQPPAEIQPARTLEGHRNIVCSVAFSRDGRLIASGSTDNTAIVWDSASGAAVHTLAGHPGTVGFVAFLPDGEMLVSSANETRLWRAANGRLERKIGNAESMALTPDGKFLVAVDRSSTALSLRLLDLESGEARWTQSWSTVSMHAAAVSPDGRIVATGCGPRGGIQLWSAADGEPVRTLDAANESIWSIAFGPDGRTLAAACFDGVVRLWNPDTGALARVLYGNCGTAHAVAFSPDGRWLAIGDERMQLWNIAQNRQVATLTGEDVAERKYSPEAIAIARQIVLERTYTVEAVAFSPDGRRVAAGCTDETVKIWDIAGLDQD